MISQLFCSSANQADPKPKSTLASETHTMPTSDSSHPNDPHLLFSVLTSFSPFSFIAKRG